MGTSDNHHEGEDVVKLTHELVTEVLTLSRDLPCHWSTFSDGGGCRAIGTHHIFNGTRNNRGLFCLPHARQYMGPMTPEQDAHYIRPNPLALRVQRATEMAQRIVAANPSRDYLRKNADGLKMGVAVLVRRGTRLLATANTRRGGFWEFPGGGVEAHETVQEAAAREAEEEAKVVLTDMRVLCTWNDAATYECTFVLAKIDPSTEPSEGDAGPVDWRSREDLETNPHFGPSVTEALTRLSLDSTLSEWWNAP